MSEEGEAPPRYHGNTGIPSMSGNFRTDLALCNLARLCHEIARSAAAREDEAREAAKRAGKEAPADRLPARRSRYS